MTLTGAFVAHEARLQFRSTRFRSMALVYVVISSIPAAFLFILGSRAHFAIGSAAYVDLTDRFQPFFTALLAMILSIDAIAREREEGSFAVVSIAPISATGYLLRRWLAVVAIALPATLAPRVIGAALATASLHAAPLVSAFLGGWLIHIAPLLVLMSGLTLAFGTINPNSIVAMVVTLITLTAGIEEANEIFSHVHRHTDGTSGLFLGNLNGMQQLRWVAQGYMSPSFPTDAGYPFAEELDEILPPLAVLAGVTALIVAIGTRHLRRTRRDLKPWRVRDDHPLRSMIRFVNRWRDEYARDAGAEWPERIALVAGVACVVAAGAYLVHRDNYYIALAAERYRSVTENDPLPMPATIVPPSATIRVRVARTGDVSATSSLALRNDSDAPQVHLCFALNPQIRLVRVAAQRGTVRVHRTWERVGITLDPPLAPHETRTIAFDVRGTPGTTRFALRWRGGFAAQWRRYLSASTSFDLSDLSRSTVDRDADEVRMQLDARDFVPVPRYTAWSIPKHHDDFVDEAVTPATAIDISVDQPYRFAADSCGAIARAAALASRCTASLARYTIFGGPMATRPLGADFTLAYIPAHERLATIHGPALNGAVGVAEAAWPGLKRNGRLLFVEQPARDDDRYWGDYVPWMALRSLASSGGIQFIQESLFRRYEPLDTNQIAAAMIVNSLEEQRRVDVDQQNFFRAFYETAALQHTGGMKRRAVLRASSAAPPREPLLTAEGYERRRMEAILAMLEYRIGGDAFIGGINDFAAGGPLPGNARDLFNAIAARAHENLDGFYDDYVSGASLPRLTFDNIVFRRDGASWDVSGALQNGGTGEAVCPIVLRTAHGSMWQTLRVAGGQSQRFTIRSPYAPLSLELDPESVCFRESYIGATESVIYKGES